MKPYCLQNYFTDEVFLQRLERSPQQDPRAAAFVWNTVWGNSLRREDLTWLRSLTTLPILLKGTISPSRRLKVPSPKSPWRRTSAIVTSPSYRSRPG
jgi:hypothetical protein